MLLRNPCKYLKSYVMASWGFSNSMFSGVILMFSRVILMFSGVILMFSRVIF